MQLSSFRLSPADVGSSSVMPPFQACSISRSPYSPLTGALSPRPGDVEIEDQVDALFPRSCITCRKRKVKCDRQQPCSNCVKGHVTCIYPPNTKRRPRGPGKKKVEGTKSEDMRKRIIRLESLLESLSGQMGMNDSPRMEGDGDLTKHAEDHNKLHLSTNPYLHPKTGSTNIAKREGSDHKALAGFNPQDVTRLLEKKGQSLYISNAFWASLSSEVEDLHEMLDGEPEDFSADIEETGVNSSVLRTHNCMLGIRDNPSSVQALRPPASHIRSYWRIFLENVDPVFHILHRLELEETVQKAVYHHSDLNRSEVALMFVIYFSAITSMPQEEIENEFGETKLVLLGRYKYAVEQALAQAGLIDTKKISTVQAFVLFIICIRRYDNARHVWMLVGLALRIALALGLHRDGQKFGLPPYQTEMRRRLWWQIYILEIRAAEDQGCNPTLDQASFDTRLPLNVNDEDLKLDAADPPTSRVGFTDMTFGLIQCETVLLSHDVKSGLLAHPKRFDKVNVLEKLRQIAACEERLQRDYLQYTSKQRPLAIVAGVIARTATAKMKLMMQNPFHQGVVYNKDIPKVPTHSSLDGGSYEDLFLLSIAILEDSIFLLTDPSIKQWVWASRKYIHWHPLTIILTELCRRPLSSLTERAWKAVDGVLQAGDIRADATVCDGRDAVLWRPIMKLIAKAKLSTGADRDRGTGEGVTEMSPVQGNRTVGSSSEADNHRIGEQIGGDNCDLDHHRVSMSFPQAGDVTTPRTAGFEDSCLPSVGALAGFNSYTAMAWDEPQNTWGASMNQFQLDIGGDESSYFQSRVFEHTSDWW